jgi:OHCU decarboxylase
VAKEVKVTFIRGEGMHPGEPSGCMTLAEINASDRAAFVAVIGPAYERSPWIAQAVWDRRPFRDVDALCAALAEVLEAASQEQRIAVIAEHPDLAGRMAREGHITPASRGEQSAAGLDRLTAEQGARFDELNSLYRKRFGFPFVICARENTASSMLSALATRANNDRETEIAIALDEIGKIARLRLHDIVEAG